MTTLHEAKARLFRDFDRKGRGHVLDSIQRHVEIRSGHARAR